jgi:hypothetical protein
MFCIVTNSFPSNSLAAATVACCHGEFHVKWDIKYSRMIKNKDVQVRGHGLCYGTTLTFAWSNTKCINFNHSSWSQVRK